MKILLTTATAAVLALTVSNCRSIDKATIGGKPTVTATQVAPVIFGAIGASAQDCLDAISKEGATEIDAVKGPNESFFISRLSGSESCQATGIVGGAAAPAAAPAKAAPAAAPAKAPAKKGKK